MHAHHSFLKPDRYTCMCWSPASLMQKDAGLLFSSTSIVHLRHPCILFARVLLPSVINYYTNTRSKYFKKNTISKKIGIYADRLTDTLHTAVVAFCKNMSIVIWVGDSELCLCYNDIGTLFAFRASCLEEYVVGRNLGMFGCKPHFTKFFVAIRDIS